MQHAGPGVKRSPGQLEAPGLIIIREVRKQIFLQVLQGNAGANIRFEDLRSLLKALGFAERIKGSHHIYTIPGSQN